MKKSLQLLFGVLMYSVQFCANAQNSLNPVVKWDSVFVFYKDFSQLPYLPNVVHTMDTFNANNVQSFYGNLDGAYIKNASGQFANFPNTPNAITAHGTSAGRVTFANPSSTITSHCYDGTNEYISVDPLENATGLVPNVLRRNFALNTFEPFASIAFDGAVEMIAPIKSDLFVIVGIFGNGRDKNGTQQMGGFCTLNTITQTLTPVVPGLTSNYLTHSIGKDGTIAILCKRDLRMFYAGQTALKDNLYPPLPRGVSGFDDPRSIYCIDKNTVYIVMQSPENPRDCQVFSLDFAQFKWVPILKTGLNKTKSITFNEENLITGLSGEGSKLDFVLSSDSINGVSTSHVVEYDVVSKTITSLPEITNSPDWFRCKLIVFGNKKYLVDDSETLFGNETWYWLRTEANLSTASLCNGGNVLISSSMTGTNYQWQVNTGNGFTNIHNNSNYNGTNTINLQLVNIPSSWYGYQYRCVVNGNYSYTTSLKFITTWSGAVSNVWENPANWSCGVPDGNTDVDINNGTVILKSNASCRSFTVNPSVIFTINPGYNLTVTH